MWNITEQVLIVLVEKNPKKAGSGAGEGFDLYRHGMTRQEARTAGLRTEDFRWDEKRIFIKFRPPFPPAKIRNDIDRKGKGTR